MPRIHALPPEVVGQIAAGEVVERPASAIKELVENSLDAGATRIDIEVAGGGADLIRVVDDGGGIHPADIELAVANHATSKVAAAADLAGVATLGFRGEALASLAAVSRFRLQSRPPDLPLGADITVQGGDVKQAVAWAGPPGTRVEVRNLFFNTPARRKFLRTADTELGHIREAFVRLALARLGVHLTLTQDGRLVYEVPQRMGFLDRVALFFGSEVANALYAFQEERGGLVAAGYAADPSCDRPGPSLQYLFVNGRWVRDRCIFQAVQDAYKGLVMTGRYPVAFVLLDLPAGEVDVNAHPAKAEVRFRDRGVVSDVVRAAVRARLDQADLTARAVTARKAKPDDRAPWEVPAAATAQSPDAPQVERPRPSHPVPPPDTPRRTEPRPAPPLFSSAGTAGPGVSGRPPAVRAFQVLRCYLVVEVPPDEVLIVDQHALHERVLYERLLARLAAGTAEAQRLLTPEVVDLPPAQAALVLAHRDALAGLGLLVDDFGGGTVLVTGYPAALDRQPPLDLVREVAERLAELGRAPDREHLLHDLAALAACHSAVRAGDALTDAEMAGLLANLDLVRDAHHCPHGRPTAVAFDRRALDKLFKRVMSGSPERPSRE
jgi:DNA mismatch repair protein MutL